jgi:hypothetical protein
LIRLSLDAATDPTQDGHGVVSIFPAGESQGQARFHEESRQKSSWTWREKHVLLGGDVADIVWPKQAIGLMTASAMTLRRICERYLEALYSVAATRKLERAAATTLSNPR